MGTKLIWKQQYSYTLLFITEQTCLFVQAELTVCVLYMFRSANNRGVVKVNNRRPATVQLAYRQTHLPLSVCVCVCVYTYSICMCVCVPDGLSSKLEKKKKNSITLQPAFVSPPTAMCVCVSCLG